MGQLFGGILIGAFVFAATLFSIAQVMQQTGRLRRVHLAAAVLTVAAMATLSLVTPLVAKIVGVALIVAALAAMVLETGWNRVLPVFHILFGAALLAGLPFGG